MYSVRLEWPQDSTNRSRLIHSGCAGSWRITFWNSRYAAGARLMAVPGWPLPTFCTASMASTRTVSTALSSRSVQSSRWVSLTRFLPGLPAGQQLGFRRLRHRAYSPVAIDCEPHIFSSRYPRNHVTYVGHSAPAVAQSEPGRATVKDVLAAYVGLTKPRVIELLLLTTVPVMFFAARGVPSLGLVIATVIGGTLSAGSASALNCVYDRDIDEQMRRTRRRALPRHLVSPGSALVFGVVLGILATIVLATWVNWLSAGLALAAEAFYLFVYTMLLDRKSVV